MANPNIASTSIAIAAGAVVTGHGTYKGLTCRETTGAACAFRVRDGVAGVILEDLSLGPSESWPIRRNDAYANGLFVELVSGTLPEGTLKYTPST